MPPARAGVAHIGDLPPAPPRPRTPKSYCESQRGTLFRDEELAGAVKTLREEGRLTFTEEDAQLREPRVVCSPGLIAES
jgi:hypothetical protein